MNEVQDHLVTLAMAHAERLVLERFIDGVQSRSRAHARELLGDLAGLYALHTMERNRAWYLEAGYMEAGENPSGSDDGQHAMPSA